MAQTADNIISFKSPERSLGRGAEPRKRDSHPQVLNRADLPIDTIELAQYLIGKTLVRELRGAVLSGRIVETEAYPVGDAAGHAWRGCTRANRSLFLGHGHAYTYFIYGSCWCVNVTSELPGIGGGVLLRATEPLEGIAQMKRNRKVARDIDIARGPGRLAQAMRIDGKFDGIDLCERGAGLWLGDAARPVGRIGVSTRIGLSKQAHRRLRFYERGSAFVSGPLALRK